MKRFFSLILLLGLPLGSHAFDHYMLAVTLTPAFCDNNPNWRNSVQCRDRQAFNVHGLWPQGESAASSPSYCNGGNLQLGPEQQRRLRGIMPDASQRDYQWKKHGRCSGLAANRYFDTLSKQFLSLRWPASLQPRGRDAIMEKKAVIRAFRQENPSFPEAGVVLRCDNKGRPPLLQEIRVCLTEAGKPRACAEARSNCPAVVKIRAR